MSKTCSLKDVEVSDLALFDEISLVMNSIKIIQMVNSKDCKPFSKIIEIAALLPELSRMEEIIAKAESQIHRSNMQVVELEHTRDLSETVDIIRGTYSLSMRKNPHMHELEVIEALGKVTKTHFKKEEQQWKDVLLQTLLNNENLQKHTTIWINNFESIKKLIEVFDLPKNKFDEIFDGTFKNDNELCEVGFWINHCKKIKELIEFFDLSEEDARSILERALTNDEKMKNLEILTKHLHGLKELIKVFSLSEEKVRAIVVQHMHENIESLSEIFNLEEPDKIESKLKMLLKDDFLLRCIKSIKEMNLNINPVLYRDAVEEFIKEANKHTSTDLRYEAVKIAIKVYKTLREEDFDIKGREFILITHDSVDKRPTNNTIKAASWALEFNYIKQNEDSWIFRNLHIIR